MCLHCVGEYEELFEVMPNVWLSRATFSAPLDNIECGDFALWRNSVNKPFVTFKFEPFTEPYENLTDEEINSSADGELEDVWLHNLASFQEALILSPEAGYDLMQSAIASGYKQEEEGLTWWLLARIGRMLDEHKRSKEETSTHK